MEGVKLRGGTEAVVLFETGRKCFKVLQFVILDVGETSHLCGPVRCSVWDRRRGSDLDFNWVFQFLMNLQKSCLQPLK
jgi:hypothetical protein